LRCRDKEFEKFVKETPVLLETKQKVERIATHKKYSDNLKINFMIILMES
jgi:hypothetical protein